MDFSPFFSLCFKGHAYVEETLYNVSMQNVVLTFVFLLFRGSSESLPRQRPSDEIHKDVTQGFHVIPTTLLDSQVRVDGGVAGGASQVLVFPVRNVLVTPHVSVLLGKPKIDDVNEVAFFAKPPEKERKY